jgi:hydrogenase nickel incorporation protein HypA/HybF
MHEYSIVQSLLDSCEEYAQQNGASKVLKVVVKIGVMSGVEPDLLRIAFDTFKENTLCAESALILHSQKVKIECRSCHTVSELEKNEYRCLQCESTDINVIDGEDMFLMSLELA